MVSGWISNRPAPTPGGTIMEFDYASPFSQFTGSDAPDEPEVGRPKRDRKKINARRRAARKNRRR